MSDTLTGAVDEFLNEVAADVRERRRQLRESVDESVSITFDGQSNSTKLVEISDRGARLKRVPGLETDLTVELQFEDGSSRTGRVTWTDEEFADLELNPANAAAEESAEA